MTDILDLIDNALHDVMSPDAMRWTPEAPKEVPASEWASGGYPLGQMFVDFGTAFVTSGFTEDELERIGELVSSLPDGQLVVDLTPIEPPQPCSCCWPATDLLLSGNAYVGVDSRGRWVAARQMADLFRVPRRLIVRNGPKPLPIDGAAYYRRSRARRRRR